MRNLLVVFIALAMSNIAANLAFATRCTGEQIEKMISSGFSKDEIKSLCDDSVTTHKNSPPSVQGNLFSGQWEAQYKITGYALNNEKRPWPGAQSYDERWDINFRDDQLEIEVDGQRLEASSVQNNDRELTFITVKKDTGDSSARMAGVPFYPCKLQFSEEITKYYLRLVDQNRIQGQIRSSERGVEKPRDSSDISQALICREYSRIIEKIINMKRIGVEAPNTGFSTFPKINK